MPRLQELHNEESAGLRKLAREQLKFTEHKLSARHGCKDFSSLTPLEPHGSLRRNDYGGEDLDGLGDAPRGAE